MRVELGQALVEVRAVVVGAVALRPGGRQLQGKLPEVRPGRQSGEEGTEAIEVEGRHGKVGPGYRRSRRGWRIRGAESRRPPRPRERSRAKAAVLENSP